jgi:hypothetical protein
VDVPESDPGFDPDLWTCTGTSVEAVTTDVPSGWTGLDRVNVIVMPTDDGATVKWIGAPELEADGCACAGRHTAASVRWARPGAAELDWHGACSESRNAQSP